MDQISEYIKQAKASGMTDDQIRQELLSAGWGEGDINLALVSKKKSKKYLKIFGVVVILIVVVYILSFQVFPQIGLTVWAKTYFSQSKTPQAYVAVVEYSPTVPLFDTSFLQVAKQGITFKPPWAEVQKEKEVENTSTLAFSDGKSLTIIKSSTNLLTDFLEGNPKDAEKIRTIFGENNLKNNFKFLDFIFRTSPNDMHFSMSRKDALEKFITIALKSLLVLNDEGKIYKFEFDNVRGFQFGEVGERGNVLVSIFNPEDNQWDLIMKNVSQKEIDYIISSIEFN